MKATQVEVKAHDKEVLLPGTYRDRELWRHSCRPSPFRFSEIFERPP